MRKVTLEEFINRSKKKHNNKFDYSKCIYINKYTKVEIICPIHGSFWQIPNNHYFTGCALCSYAKLSLTKEEFVNRSNIIHNNKYDYSLVEYTNSTTKVKIICPVHNVFLQYPKQHLKGHSCEKCYREKPKKYAHTISYLIEKGTEIYGLKYNYSLSNFRSVKK